MSEDARTEFGGLGLEPSSALGLCVLLSSLGCQNNTIELEFPMGSTGGATSDTNEGTADGSTGTPPPPPPPATSTSTTTSTTVTTSPPPPPTTVTASATATTGPPPPSNACQAYAQLIDTCYGEYYEDAYLYCLEYLETVTAQYGEECGLLLEEYMVCLSNLTCRELGSGNTPPCDEIYDAFQLQCP